MIVSRIPLITLGRHPLPYSEQTDPEKAFRISRRAGFTEAEASSHAAYCTHLPVFDGENELIHWSIEDVRRLRWTAWRLERAARLRS